MFLPDCERSGPACRVVALSFHRTMINCLGQNLAALGSLLSSKRT